MIVDVPTDRARSTRVRGRAWAVVERMRALAEAHGLPLNPNKIDTIARIQIALGRYAEAERTVEGAIRDYHALGFDEADALPEYLLTLAVAQRCQGATDKAQASLDSSSALCDERGLHDVRVRILEEQAELHAAAGDFARAFAAHKTFHDEYGALQSGHREAQARTRHAMFETALAAR
jgi:lipopolysaccharide biosynthesis regulator YciM